MKRRKTGDLEFFRKLAVERMPADGIFRCEVTGERIGRLNDLRVINFSHVKGKGAHPDLRFEPSNVRIVSEKYHRYQHTGAENLRRELGLQSNQ